MDLRVSAAFARQFKCVPGEDPAKGTPPRRLDDWSCHFIRVRRKPLVIAMNDATLYTLILPVSGVKGFAEVWLRLIARIAGVRARYGGKFDPRDQVATVSARSDRSRIGSMNDAIQLIRLHDLFAKEEKTELDLVDMERRSNQTPYKALGYGYPERLMEAALRGEE